MQLAAGLAEHEKLRIEATAASSSSASEAAALRQRCATLAAELSGQESLLQSMVADAQAAARSSEAVVVELQLQLRATEVSHHRILKSGEQSVGEAVILPLHVDRCSL